jgi:hypothetical protein
MAAMKIRPIIFSGPMVRALLDGRKTQTRRIINLKTGDTFDEHALVGAIQEWRPFYDVVAQRIVGKEAALVRCPYGLPGDLLYVREAFAYVGSTDPGYLVHRADYPTCALKHGFDRVPETIEETGARWKPSIHMPRQASRLTLEITEVRAERLLAISEDDAKAEGLHPYNDYWEPWPMSGKAWRRPQDAFRQLWQSINGPESWDANPWVWVVNFRVHRCNVDELLQQREAA